MPEPTNARSLGALAASLILAAVLTIPGLGWGLPAPDHFQSFHGGESRAVGVALQMDVLAGDLVPTWRGRPFFKWGSHSLYAFHAAFQAASVLGALEVGGEPATWPRDELAVAHRIARGVTVAYFLGTVTLAFFIARSWYGRATAAAASLATAASPLLAYESHFATSNPCLTFWCVAALGLAGRAARERGVPAFLLAGGAAGLAVAAKLSALPLLATGAVACVLTLRGSGLAATIGRGAAFLAGVAIGFFLATPAALLHWSDFQDQALDELLGHSESGHGLLFIGTGNGLLYLLWTNLRVGLSHPLWIASLAGVSYAAWRVRAGLRSGSAAGIGDALLLSWILVNAAIFAKAEVRYLRYLMPLCPLFSIAAARAAVRWVAWPSRRALRSVNAVAAVLALVWTLAYSFANALPFTRPDPKQQLAEWFRAEVPGGSSVGAIKRPSHLTAPLYSLAADPFGAGTYPEHITYREVPLYRDPDLLERDPPELVVWNTLELREEERLKQRLGERPEDFPEDLAARIGETLALRANIEDAYERAHAPFVNPVPPPFDWPTPPRGWNAATQTLEVWRRRP